MDGQLCVYDTVGRSILLVLKEILVLLLASWYRTPQTDFRSLLAVMWGLYWHNNMPHIPSSTLAQFSNYFPTNSKCIYGLSAEC